MDLQIPKLVLPVELLGKFNKCANKETKLKVFPGGIEGKLRYFPLNRHSQGFTQRRDEWQKMLWKEDVKCVMNIS